VLPLALPYLLMPVLYGMNQPLEGFKLGRPNCAHSFLETFRSSRLEGMGTEAFAIAAGSLFFTHFISGRAIGFCLLRPSSEHFLKCGLREDTPQPDHPPSPPKVRRLSLYGVGGADQGARPPAAGSLHRAGQEGARRDE